MRIQKEQGQYMTPNKIVKMILDNLSYTGTHILYETIIEPSFGDGAFLIEIVERMIEMGEKIQLPKNAIASCIEKHLFGIEKDSILYQKAITRLNTYTLTHDIKVDWSKNLLCGDTLLLYHQLEKQFDYVVGNPPFVRIHNIAADYRKILDTFQFSKGMRDLYIFFYEIGMALLKNTGKLGFITPNSFLKNTSCQDFRDYIIDNHYISKLYNFQNSKIFLEASTYTCICILDKQTEDVIYREYEMYEKKSENIFTKEEFETHYRTYPWNLCGKEDMDFLERNGKSIRKIKDIATIQNGIVTNLDSVYIHKIFLDTQCTILYQGENIPWVYFEEDGKIIEIERDILRPCVKESKYHGKIDTYIIFPYKNGKTFTEEDWEKFQKAYTYLGKHREKLEKRDMDYKCAWWEYGRRQGLKNIGKKKIIFSHIINRKCSNIQPYLLGEDVVVYSGLYLTTDGDLEKIVDILKSEDFSRYCTLVGKDMSGGYVSVSSKMVKNFGTVT